MRKWCCTTRPCVEKTGPQARLRSDFLSLFSSPYCRGAHGMGPGSALKLGPIYKWDEIKLSGKKFKARLKYNLPKLSIYVSQQRLKKKGNKKI